MFLLTDSFTFPSQYLALSQYLTLHELEDDNITINFKMGIKKKSPKVQLLRSLFESIRKNVKLWDCWRTTEQWINVMNSFFPEAADFEFTKGDLGRMLATDPVYKHCFMQYGSHTNQHGLYIDKFKKGNIRNTAIYCCLPDSTVRRPPNDAK